jgi:hypothetical protein
MNKRWPYKLKRGFLLLAFTPLLLYSQDSDQQSSLVFNGYVKDMQTCIFQNIQGNWTYENLIHNRLNFKWLISPSFTAALELRNRLVVGNIFSAYPGYDQTFEVDHGIVNLTKNLIDEKYGLLNTDIDRLWLQYTTGNFQITAGRQRINWGQTFVWNPNDIFNSYSYFDFDYEEKPGSDAVRLQYFPSPTSDLEFAVKENDQKKATFAGLYRFNKWNYDIQFLGGMMNQSDLVIGSGWSGQIGGGGFRGEATYFHRAKNPKDTTGTFVASIEYDYTFKNSLALQFETLYNGAHTSTNLFSLSQLNSSNMSAENLFLPGSSFFCSLSYPFTPLINASLAGIENMNYQWFFLIPSITISLKENLELSFTAQILRNAGHNEPDQNVNLVYARLKKSF